MNNPKIWVLTIMIVFIGIACCVCGEDGNLRSDKASPPTSSSARLYPPRISVASSLSSPRRLSGRRLQENQFNGLLDGFNQLIGNIPVVGNVGQNLNNLISGGWRSFGKVINGGGIPAVGTVLDRLSVGRISLNGLQTQLDEVASVFGILPMVGQQFGNFGAQRQRSTVFAGNLFSSGVFGINGFLGSAAAGFSNSLSTMFESSMFSRFGNNPLFHSGFLKGYTADLSGVNLSDIEEQQQAAGLAQEDARLLGAQIDALTSLFSGGVQVPFIGTLFDVDKAFSLLAMRPDDVNLWSQSVLALQQLREDLLRLPLGFSLNTSQESSVNQAVSIIDNLLKSIGGNTGMIDLDFFNSIKGSLQALGSSLLKLDGSNLIPRVGLNGLDISSQLSSLSDGLLSIPLDLADLSFLNNGFGLAGFESVLRTPVALGAAAMDQLSTVASQAFFSDLLARTVGAVPAMLGEAVQVGGMLSSVSDGLLSALQLSKDWDSSLIGRVGDAFNGGATVTDLDAYLQQFFGMGGQSSENSIVSFVKLLQLETAMNTAQSLINNLQEGPGAFVNQLLPNELVGSLFKNGFASSLFNGDGQLAGYGGALSSVGSNLVGGLASLPRELANNLANGVDHLTQLPGSFDRFRLFNNRRRLQESANSDFLVDLDKADIESLALFASSASILNALSVVDLIVEDTLSSPCLTEAEVEAMQTVRGAALIGNPIDVMKATETSDATIVDILSSTSDASMLKPDTLRASSALCEQRREALIILQKWTTETVSTLSAVFVDSLVETPEAVQSSISNLELLSSCSSNGEIPTPPSRL